MTTITLTGIPTPETTADFLNIELQLINAVPGITVYNPVHNNSVIYYENNVREWDDTRANSLRVREMITQIAESDCVLMLIETDFVTVIAEILGIPVYTSIDEAVGALSSGTAVPVLEPIAEPVSNSLWCEGCNDTGGTPLSFSEGALLCQGNPIPGCNLYRSYNDAAEGDVEKAVKL